MSGLLPAQFHLAGTVLPLHYRPLLWSCQQAALSGSEPCLTPPGHEHCGDACCSQQQCGAYQGQDLAAGDWQLWAVRGWRGVSHSGLRGRGCGARSLCRGGCGSRCRCCSGCGNRCGRHGRSRRRRGFRGRDGGRKSHEGCHGGRGHQGGGTEAAQCVSFGRLFCCGWARSPPVMGPRLPWAVRGAGVPWSPYVPWPQGV